MGAHMVSMKHEYVPADAKLESVGAVKSQVCADDPNAANGLMDEAVSRAQKSKKADFIGSPVFTASGFWVRCVEVSGEGMKIAE